MHERGIAKILFEDYRRGWIRGASESTVSENESSAWMAGYCEGRAALCRALGNWCFEIAKIVGASEGNGNDGNRSSSN